MTKKAKEIGARDTVFGSPNGLDSHLTAEQHHSTAYDIMQVPPIFIHIYLLL